MAGHAVGALGFCLGGTLAYHLAAVAQPATAVCYYGSGIADALSAADQIECPVLFHFGAQDGYIPLADAERVAEVAAQHAGWECAIQPDGGHAFDNHDSEMFSRPEAAARAWELTSSFLARTLQLEPSRLREVRPWRRLLGPGARLGVGDHRQRQFAQIGSAPHPGSFAKSGVIHQPPGAKLPSQFAPANWPPPIWRVLLAPGYSSPRWPSRV